MSPVSDTRESIGTNRRGNSAESNSNRTPEQLAADLAETRERLADTVDALVDRVQPKHVAGRAAGNVKGYFVEPDGELRTDRIVKIGAGVVGAVGGLLLLRRLVRGGGGRGRGVRRRGKRWCG